MPTPLPNKHIPHPTLATLLLLLTPLYLATGTSAMPVHTHPLSPGIPSTPLCITEQVYHEQRHRTFIPRNYLAPPFFSKKQEYRDPLTSNGTSLNIEY